MIKKAAGRPRPGAALCRESIVEASIEVLDASGEQGLTFRVLSERLRTGPGAIYGYVANKTDLLAAACDVVIARTMDEIVLTAPEETIRAIAAHLFDAIDKHPWVGSTITSSEGLSPIVRMLERLGQQIRALRVPDEQQWAAVSTVLAYILGVSKQNAANGQLARSRGLARPDFLAAVSTAWSALDNNKYPFTRSVAGQLREHDDRADFLAGIDVILKGLQSPQRRTGNQPKVTAQLQKLHRSP